MSATDPSLAPPGLNAGLGRHTASFAESVDDHFDFLAPTFMAAIAQGCRCLFIGHRTMLTELREALTRRGCSIEKPLANDQFRFLTADETYLKGGSFDADRMLDLLAETAASARAEGVSGLCASGEVTWLDRQVPGSDRWLEYEYRINELEVLPQAAVTCLYDTRALSGWLASEIKKVHPFIHTNHTLTANPGFASSPDRAAEVPLAEDLEPAADRLPCAQLALLLSAYVDGQLAPRRRHETARHLAACDWCAEEVESYRALKSGLAGLRLPARVGSDVWESVRARLKDLPPPLSGQREGGASGGKEQQCR